MAEPRDYTPHQQKIIRRYYDNQGAIREQSLAELVSDIYLATTDKKRDALWERARKLLDGLGVAPATSAAVLARRDPRALAELASKAFGSDPKADRRRDAADGRRDA